MQTQQIIPLLGFALTITVFSYYVLRDRKAAKKIRDAKEKAEFLDNLLWFEA